MSILEGIRAVEFDKNKRKVFGIKSGILWGHSNKSNSTVPLLYISKPRWMTQEDFDSILEKVDIRIRK